MSLGTLPAWGMTRGGELYELPTPERRISEPESLSLLGTPLQDDGSNANPSPSRRETLASLAFLPTPVTQPNTGNGHARNLGKEIHMLPTPAVNDMGAGKDPVAWDAWTERMRQEHGNGNGHGKSLEQEALRMLPTPTVQQGRNAPSGRQDGSQHHDGWTLQDVVYAGLLGDSTSPRSADGSDSQDQPQPPLFSTTDATG